MSIRTRIANWGIAKFRRLGRKEGSSELAVFIDDHSIKPRMVDVDRDDLAWDDNLYRRGNLYVRGYANPVKPTVEHHPELEDSDEVEIASSSVADTSVQDQDSVDVIASERYKSYMKQELVESLLNPKEQWKIIAYAIVALAILMAMNLVATVFTSGAV